MLDRGASAGIRPVTVAPVMIVFSVRMKSSAVSASGFPALGGWDSAPSRPSAVPVVKKKDSAKAGVADKPAINVTAVRAIVLIGDSPFEFLDVLQPKGAGACGISCWPCRQSQPRNRAVRDKFRVCGGLRWRRGVVAPYGARVAGILPRRALLARPLGVLGVGAVEVGDDLLVVTDLGIEQRCLW